MVRDECRFIVVPAGGWTLGRAVGRAALGLLALSGPGGLTMVGALVLLKERHHIATALRQGLERVRTRRSQPAAPERGPQTASGGAPPAGRPGDGGPSVAPEPGRRRTGLAGTIRSPGSAERPAPSRRRRVERTLD